MTLAMMIIEITAGYIFGSMALLADGWHMGTHAAALGITALAYYYARKHSDNPNYSFGTDKVLLDRDVNEEAVEKIRSIIESDSDNRVSDLHVWRVGSHHLSAIISIVTHYPKSPDHYKKLLSDYNEMAHVTVEVNPCEGDPCQIEQEPPSRAAQARRAGQIQNRRTRTPQPIS